MDKSLLEKNITLDRRASILENLGKNGIVQVNILSKSYKVSEVTIRNDLIHLEKKGLLIRTRGGAIKQQSVSHDFPLNEKAIYNLNEKQRIAKKAVEFINEGDTIILDSGTTTLEIAKNLASFNNLTVITNAINIAGQLAQYKNLRVIMVGGTLRSKSLSLVGTTAEDSLKNFYCDKVFMGVDGIDTAYGISTPNIEEAHLNRVMINVSRELIVVTDYSKFLKRSLALICPISKINKIITDKKIPKEELYKLNNSNIETIIV